MATYYVTSADAGAVSAGAVLTGVAGSGITVLDYILNTVAGLTIHFTGTNKRIYTMSNGDQLFAADDTTTSGSAQLMTVRIAESASSISSLTDPFPTVALVADNAATWLKSTSANSTARAWWALVDTTNHVFILLVDASNASPGTFVSGGGWWAGGQSILPSDNYCSVLNVRSTTGTSASVNIPFTGFSTPGAVVGYLWWKRTRDGTIKSSYGGLGPYNNQVNPGFGASAGPAYPHPDDSKMRRARMTVSDYYSTTSTIGASVEPLRIFVPHVWVGMHKVSGYSGIAIGDTFTDSAYNTQVGATAAFAFFPLGSASGSAGAIILETSNTWTLPQAA